MADPHWLCFAEPAMEKATYRSSQIIYCHVQSKTSDFRKPNGVFKTIALVPTAARLSK